MIRPLNHKLMIAVTARCNANCLGCRYNHDFMNGRQLDLASIEGILKDAAAAGFRVIRFYGGEPLLHKDLPHMISKCRDLGMEPYITTNAVLLDRHIDTLYQSGLRDITVGFYGVHERYDRYVQRLGFFEKMRNGIDEVRSKYGDRLNMQINWLLMKPTCDKKYFFEAVDFANRFDMRLQIELVHYSLPYFREGPDGDLQFGPEDSTRIRNLTNTILEVKSAQPGLINQTHQTIRSIPDWLIQGPRMRVPCTVYDMLWIGADGSVQLCYVTFPLGNIKNQSLQSILQSKARIDASRRAFRLDCPNCHCGANDRIMRHLKSRRKYSG